MWQTNKHVTVCVGFIDRYSLGFGDLILHSIVSVNLAIEICDSSPKGVLRLSVTGMSPAHIFVEWHSHFRKRVGNVLLPRRLCAL